MTGTCAFASGRSWRVRFTCAAIALLATCAAVAGPVPAASPQTPPAAGSSSAGAATTSAFEDVRTDFDGLSVTARVVMPAPGQPIAFEVGVPFDVELTFAAAPGTTAPTVDVARNLGDFDVFATLQPSPTSDDAPIARLTLMTLASGTIAPPPVTVRWTRNGALREGMAALPAVTIASVLGEEIAPESYRDIAGEIPLAEPWSATTLAIALLAPIAVVVGGLVIRRFLRRTVAPLSADGAALGELEALEREALPARAEFGRYYERLSGVVRRYVLRRFGIAAERQTSRELLAAATAHPEFPEAERERLRGLLRLADLVKFADVTPERAECDAHLADARAFIASTREQPDANDSATPTQPQEVAR
jgi:hypothetical protein